MPPLVVETALSLKDFVGREIAVTDWFVMTQDRIDRLRRPHGHQLRPESGPLSLCCSRGLKNSRPRETSVLEGAFRCA